MKSARFAGWSAILGAGLGILITPFMAAVWTYEDGVVWDGKPWLVETVGPTLESWGALTFGPPFPYEVYGKTFVFVYLSMLPIVQYIHRLQTKATTSVWERQIWRAVWIGLIVATVGDGFSYWGISLPEPVGPVLWSAGFGFELIGLLVVFVSTTVYGVVSLRLRVIPLWAAGLLVAVVPAAIGTLIVVTSYVPNAVVVPMSMIWAAIGVWVLVCEVDDSVPGLAPLRESA